MARHEATPTDVDANERDKDLELKAIREQFREPLKKPVQTTPRAKQPAQRVPLHLPVEFVKRTSTSATNQLTVIQESVGPKKSSRSVAALLPESAVRA